MQSSQFLSAQFLEAISPNVGSMNAAKNASPTQLGFSPRTAKARDSPKARCYGDDTSDSSEEVISKIPDSLHVVNCQDNSNHDDAREHRQTGLHIDVDQESYDGLLQPVPAAIRKNPTAKRNL